MWELRVVKALVVAVAVEVGTESRCMVRRHTVKPCCCRRYCCREARCRVVVEAEGMSRVVEAEGMSRGLQVGSLSGAWEVESPTVAEAARLTRLVMVAAEEAARQACPAVAAAQ